MTNRQWLGTLTDEEFADWATGEDSWDPSFKRYVGLFPHRRNVERRYNSSYLGILDWLKEERADNRPAADSGRIGEDEDAVHTES